MSIAVTWERETKELKDGDRYVYPIHYQFVNLGGVGDADDNCTIRDTLITIEKLPL